VHKSFTHPFADILFISGMTVFSGARVSRQLFFWLVFLSTLKSAAIFFSVATPGMPIRPFVKWY
jgi:hypothetical protein